MDILKSLKNNPIVSAIAVLGIGYLIYKSVTKKTAKVPVAPPIAPVPGRATTQPKQVKYTYGQQDYLNFAEGLFRAMDNTGTDEDAIKRIMMQMKTYDDVLALINAYGKRKWTKWEIWDLSPTLMTLSEALNDELSSSDLDEYVNQPLAKTGYKF